MSPGEHPEVCLQQESYYLGVYWVECSFSCAALVGKENGNSMVFKLGETTWSGTGEGWRNFSVLVAVDTHPHHALPIRGTIAPNIDQDCLLLLVENFAWLKHQKPD